MNDKELLLLKYLIDSLNIVIPEYEKYLLNDSNIEPQTKLIRKNSLEIIRKVINGEKFY